MYFVHDTPEESHTTHEARKHAAILQIFSEINKHKISLWKDNVEDVEQEEIEIPSFIGSRSKLVFPTTTQTRNCEVCRVTYPGQIWYRGESATSNLRCEDHIDDLTYEKSIKALDILDIWLESNEHARVSEPQSFRVAGYDGDNRCVAVVDKNGNRCGRLTSKAKGTKHRDMCRQHNNNLNPPQVRKMRGCDWQGCTKPSRKGGFCWGHLRDFLNQTAITTNAIGKRVKGHIPLCGYLGSNGELCNEPSQTIGKNAGCCGKHREKGKED